MSSNLLSKILSVVLVFVVSGVQYSLAKDPPKKPAAAPVAQAAPVAPAPATPQYMVAPAESSQQKFETCMSTFGQDPNKKTGLTQDEKDNLESCRESAGLVSSNSRKTRREQDDKDRCKKMDEELNDLIKKCKGDCQENIDNCFKPDQSDPNLMKTALETYALSRGISASLSPTQQKQGAGFNCKYSPEDCHKKTESYESEIKKIQEHLLTIDRDAAEKDSQHKKALTAVEDETTRAKEEWDKRKITKNSEMQNKEIDIDRQTAVLKEEARKIQKEQDGITAQLSQAQNAARLEMMKIDGTSEANDCKSRADSKGNVKSKVSGGLGNAVASSRVAAWQAIYKQCQTEYQTKRSVLTTQYATQIDTLNKDYKNNLERLAENSTRISNQTTALENSYQAMKDQLSLDEQHYYENQIRLRKKYDQENSDDITRKQNDLKEKANLNNELAQKQKKLASMGTCPEKSNKDTTLKEDKDTYFQLKGLVDQFQPEEGTKKKKGEAAGASMCCSSTDKSYKGCTYKMKKSKVKEDPDEDDAAK